jgi:hypothetical protein
MTVADLVAPFTAFGNGEAATITVRCTEETSTAQACLLDADATQTSAVPAPTCGDDCVTFECGSCLAGDCNATGSIDAGDPVCTVLCLIGQAPASADCSCAADCNCLAGTEAGDPICSVRRLIGTFDPDTCSGDAPMYIGANPLIGTSDLHLSLGAVRPRGDQGGSRVTLRLRGEDAPLVGGLRVALSADGPLGRIRLSKRLRDAGFSLTVGRGGPNNAVFAILPPFASGGEIQPLGRGRIARAVLREPSQLLTVSGVQYGSTAGLPLRTRP